MDYLFIDYYHIHILLGDEKNIYKDVNLHIISDRDYISVNGHGDRHKFANIGSLADPRAQPQSHIRNATRIT